jgi:hypothetical protein
MSLFRRLPDGLFRPLSGPNRHVYVEILSRLHALFFGEGSTSIFPSDKTVRTEIEETLISLSLRDWVREEDDDECRKSPTMRLVTHCAPIDV